jgi:hypothetical protein
MQETEGEELVKERAEIEDEDEELLQTERTVTAGLRKIKEV